jgi:quercetin dioxygenase-like cupin family protein
VPVSKAINLLSLISYQEGSVVSRTIVNRETGNVTLFAFDEAQGLSEHTAPFDALVQVLEGEVEVSVDSKPLRATLGDVVLMPAHHPHALKAITKFKMLLTMVRS